MTDKDGGPAFPAHRWDSTDCDVYTSGGMTLRDYFAGEALKGVLYMLAHGVYAASSSPKGLSQEAYNLADAMIQTRKEIK